jgi:hypothetical protein
MKPYREYFKLQSVEFQSVFCFAGKNYFHTPHLNNVSLLDIWGGGGDTPSKYLHQEQIFNIWFHQ